MPTTTEKQSHRKVVAALYGIMAGGAWHSLIDLQESLLNLGMNLMTQTVSARVRDLRKREYGSHDVEHRKRGTLYFYRLTPRKKQQALWS